MSHRFVVNQSRAPTPRQLKRDSLKARVQRIIAVMSLCFFCVDPSEAADSSGLYMYFYRGIFDKIYLSTLFGRPQAMGYVSKDCSTMIAADTRLIKNETDRSILERLPANYLDSADVEAMRRYRFWPLHCRPVAITQMPQSWFGLGPPTQIEVRFLKTSLCQEFILNLDKVIVSTDISPYLLDPKLYQAAKVYYEVDLVEIDINISKYPVSEVERIRELLDHLRFMIRTHDCAQGTLRFYK